MSGALEAALRRERMIVQAALAILVLLAWGWLLLGAGMGAELRAEFALFPHRAAASGMEGMEGTGPGGSWTGATFLGFAMWWVMMVAMMLPSAAPVILLYARAAPREDGSPPAGYFLAGYLAVWALLSLVAALLQFALQAAGVMQAATMGSGVKWFSAAILLAAGAYQLSSVKDACLGHCRNPARFLSRHYRRGRAGAMRMGVIHGAYCVGCCWLLMALLFVGGVMNVAWIALLTLLVAAEKLLPRGRIVALMAGVVFLAWGVATALV